MKIIYGKVNKRSLHKLISKYRFLEYRNFLPMRGLRAKTYYDILNLLSNNGHCLVAYNNGQLEGILIYHKAAWDSAHFGFDVGNIDYIMTKPLSYEKELVIKKELIESFEKHSTPFRLVSTRIDAADVSSIRALEDTSFRYVCTYDTPYRSLNNKIPKPNLKVRGPHDRDYAELLEIASSFTEGRFFSDPTFDRTKAKQVYMNWLKNAWKAIKDGVYFRGNPPNFSIAELNDQAVGLIIYWYDKDMYKFTGKKVVTWDFVAVSPKYQGRGIGYHLGLGTLWAHKDADFAVTKDVASNYRAANLYRKLGFKVACVQIQMHKWLNK